MKKKMNVVKKSVGAMACALIMGVTLGISCFAAASCSLTGSLSGSTGKVTLKNTSGNIRYCFVYVREYDTGKPKTTIATNGGSISNGNTISASGKISKNHAQGVGEVYYSTTPTSGVAYTTNTSIK